jgi:hypothetical protein
MSGWVGMELLPEGGKFGWAEIGEDPAIDFDDRSEGLAGELEHFLVGLFVANDVDGFVGDAVVIEPIEGLGAPGTIGFDEQTDPFGLVHGSRGDGSG